MRGEGDVGVSRKPDFLIIGAQKCGTSWLHHHLHQAAAVFMPADKDYEHFSYVGNRTVSIRPSRPAFGRSADLT